ncbi:MAG: hypothetical protein ACOC7J_04975 [Armatimonadota bacterium]
MSWVGYTVLGVFALAVAVVGLRVWMNRLRQSALDDADRTLAGKKMVLRDPSANLIGIRSRGAGAVRGNGVLTLTERNLQFVMWLPRRSFSIALEDVTSVETPKSFMGRSKLRELLQVNFTDERGEEDAAAWVVADLPAWKMALRERTGGRS